MNKKNILYNYIYIKIKIYYIKYIKCTRNRIYALVKEHLNYQFPIIIDICVKKKRSERYIAKGSSVNK